MERAAVRSRLARALCLLILFGALCPLPLHAATFYVDAVHGDDAHNIVEAQDPATPWQTLLMAINNTQDGDTVIVRPGVYDEILEPKHSFMTWRAEPRRGAFIEGPAGSQGVLVDGLVGMTIEGFVVKGGPASAIIDFKAAGSGVVRDNVVYGNTGNGIGFSNSPNGTIEKNVVHTNGGMGIRYRHAQGAAVRNNLVYNNGSLDAASWGIQVEPAVGASDNTIEGNTVDRNSNGVRLHLEEDTGGGTIVNNIITNQTGTGLKNSDPARALDRYNDVWANGIDFDFRGASLPGPNTISVDPRYVDPAGGDGLLGEDGWEDDNYHLSQVLAGQAVTSACVNAGDPAVGVEGTTATANFPDEGAPDLGYHYPLFPSAMGEFTLTSVKTSVEKKNGGFATTYRVDGRLSLGAGSNGINPVTETVRVDLNTFSQVLPVGACKKVAALVWTCTGKIPGVKYVRIDLSKALFEIQAQDVPTPSAPLPPNLRVQLVLADDTGATERFYTRGTLLFP